MRLTIDVDEQDLESFGHIEGVIYKSASGPHDPDGGLRRESKGWRYDCYMPVSTGNCCIVDCWVCDKHGNIHPGYSESPVPVCVSNLGKIVGTIQEQ